MVLVLVPMMLMILVMLVMLVMLVLLLRPLLSQTFFSPKGKKGAAGPVIGPSATRPTAASAIISHFHYSRFLPPILCVPPVSRYLNSIHRPLDFSLSPSFSLALLPPRSSLFFHRPSVAAGRVSIGPP